MLSFEKGRRAMNNILRLWAFAAAASVAAGCSDRSRDSNATQSGTSVILEVRESTTPVIAATTTNVAVGTAEASSKAAADVAPAKNTDVPATKNRRKPLRFSRESELSGDAATAAATDKNQVPKLSAESASLPLPSAVILRTIEKIGFPCGSIVSSSKIEGASGSSDYRIDCSSGASYRASNRTGRYRFSKADKPD